MILDFFSSSFCDPCIQTRSVLADVKRMVPAVEIRDMDVARYNDLAADANIRSTPTIIVRSADGTEVFRAEGVPNTNQVLVALTKAL